MTSPPTSLTTSLEIRATGLIVLGEKNQKTVVKSELTLQSWCIISIVIDTRIHEIRMKTVGVDNQRAKKLDSIPIGTSQSSLRRQAQ